MALRDLNEGGGVNGCKLATDRRDSQSQGTVGSTRRSSLTPNDRNGSGTAFQATWPPCLLLRMSRRNRGKADVRGSNGRTSSDSGRAGHQGGTVACEPGTVIERPGCV
jgi:hypothetical protein